MKADSRIVEALIKADRAYKQVDLETGEEKTWAEWCANYLLAATNFNQLTERQWQESELSEALDALRTTYRRTRPRHPWTEYFAQRLLS